MTKMNYNNHNNNNLEKTIQKQSMIRRYKNSINSGKTMEKILN
jgi:hypothetical protein